MSALGGRTLSLPVPPRPYRVDGVLTVEALEYRAAILASLTYRQRLPANVALSVHGDQETAEAVVDALAFAGAFRQCEVLVLEDAMPGRVGVVDVTVSVML